MWGWATAYRLPDAGAPGAPAPRPAPRPRRAAPGGPSHDARARAGLRSPRRDARCCSPAAASGRRSINYKQGTYQGKPDTPAYSSAPFNGNKQQWDNAIDTRTQYQNEYKRIRD